MPNGKKLTFYDNWDDEELELGKIVKVQHDYWRWWGVELTDQAAKLDSVKLTK